jgi:hypothetical protein
MRVLEVECLHACCEKDEIIKYMSAFVEEEFMGEHGIKMSAKHFVVLNVF